MKTEKNGWVYSVCILALGIGLTVALPLLGILATGAPLGRYLEFPPRTHYVQHAGFSWPAFLGLGLLIIAAVLPFVIRMVFAKQTRIDTQTIDSIDTFPPAERPGHLRKLATELTGNFGVRRFPARGWLGVGLGIGAWILAWGRFEWFAPLQRFTFSALWFGYILTVNALTYRRVGRCMLTHQPRFFLTLFPVSAVFWWLFEYLNRFVQNWYYTGILAMPPWQYFIFATLPFATVLPAVMGTCQFLATFPRLTGGLGDFLPLRFINSRTAASVALLVSAGGLVGIGLWPDILFPLLWLAPLGVVAALQILAGRPTLFADLARGDWRRVVLLALASLVCGVFWEMWNYYSQAKWVYAVPFVNRFHIFEMPILGYAGYLPFGLECAVIADLLAGSGPAPMGKERP
jgi:hypothetical protein